MIEKCSGRYFVFTVLILLTLFFSTLLYAEKQQVATVLDFKLDGISEQEGRDLCELLSYNIFESGSWLVIGPREREKLLRGLGYTLSAADDEEYIREISDLINVDVVVLAELSRKSGVFQLELARLDVHDGKKDNRSYDFPSIEALVRGMRFAAIDFLRLANPPDKTEETDSGTDRIIAWLTPATVRERMLFLLPAGKLDQMELEERVVLGSLLSLAVTADTVNAFTESVKRSVRQDVLDYYIEIMQKKNFHSLVCFLDGDEGSRERARFCIFDFNGRLSYSRQLDSGDSPDSFAKEVTAFFTARLNYVPQDILYREIGKSRKVAEKLDSLSFSEKLLDNHFALSLYSRLFSSVLVPEYHPNLNIISLNSGFYWYYNGLFGLGVEYAFSLGYPGTIDTRLADHPLVAQHEFRIIPLSFRTASKLGIVANAVLSFHFHNAYRITFLPGDLHVYDNKTEVFFITTGASFGINWNISPAMAVYFDIFGVNYIFFRGAQPNDIVRKRNFSGDFGGIGIIYRF